MTSEGGSPRRRVKFLCSYGGKIVPRPGDAHLKYIGGETRVLSIPKHLSFQDVMKRLSDLVDGEMILKYQLAAEELDALVSVKSDEDIRHMLEECDRCESAGGPRLRAFLFPAKPVVLENGSTEPQLLTQRYIDAINGISRKTVNIGSLGVSTACSSPTSPEIDGFINAAVLPNTLKNCKTGMHKVHSSPSLSSLDSHQGSPKYQSTFHHLYQNHRQQLNHSSKPPLDPHRSGTPERLPSARSVNQYQVDSVPHYYYQPSRHHRGVGGGYTAYMLPDDYGRPTYHRRVERAASPMSRVMRIGTKVWEGHISGTTEFP